MRQPCVFTYVVLFGVVLCRAVLCCFVMLCVVLWSRLDILCMVCVCAVFLCGGLVSSSVGPIHEVMSSALQ